MLLLAALAALPPLSTDINLPGLPAIARALHASAGSVQATLSTFIVAFGAGQLVLGPLSDRYGRRPVLLGGLALFTLAGLACTLTTDIRELLVARTLQGVGACAGMVNARAIVRDIAAERTHAATLQSYVSAVQSLAPIVAPMLGAAILALLGWRALYGALVIVGIGLTAAVALGLAETSPRIARSVAHAYLRSVRRPRTVALAALLFFGFGGYFTLITGSPFVLVAQFHVATAVFAAAFAVNACALLAGAYSSARLTSRIGSERLFAMGVALLAVAGVLCAAAATLAPSPVAFTATFALVAFAFGIASPSTYAAALAGAGEDAGLTSGILGSAQMIGAGICASVAGAIAAPASLAVGSTACAALLIAGIAYLWSRHAFAATMSM